jgi:hypothetical protein
MSIVLGLQNEMNLCMYACMHACMYVCVYVCMYVCMYVSWGLLHFSYIPKLGNDQ